MQLTQENRKAKRSQLRAFIGFFEHGLFAPFLLAIQPVLRLYGLNATEVYFAETIRALVAFLLLSAASLLLAKLLLRDWLKASVVTSLFVFLFFLFGDLSDWLRGILGLGPVRADFLMLVLVVAGMVLWSWIVQKRIMNLGTVNLYFNLLGILLLLNTRIPAGMDVLGISAAFGRKPPMPVAVIESTAPRPDVYYLILDGYGRRDILQALYEYDNSEFLGALESRGFYIAGESTSNYTQTLLSLSSSLNMDYIQSLSANGASFETREEMLEYLQKSRVRNTFAENGYELISFHNAYHATVPDAEIYYDDTGLSYPVTGFESIVIDRTLARVLLHVPFFKEVLIEMPYETHRNQVLATFTRLEAIPALDGDYFVFAHIIAPHPPFVFDAAGEPLPHDQPFRLADGNYYFKAEGNSRQMYISGYRNQIQYINTLVLETVDTLLAQSQTPPIIILQADHGPGSRLHFGHLDKTLPAERFGILNAYYFPDQDYTSLYPSISPVNSFRVMFNRYFDGSYALLPDQHYYSTWGDPFDFVEVNDLSLP